jgi:hypothetical protein
LSDCLLAEDERYGFDLVRSLGAMEGMVTGEGMNTTLHPLAEDYLVRLDRAAASLPPPDRSELLAELRSHLEAGLTPGSTDADARNLLHERGHRRTSSRLRSPGGWFSFRSGATVRLERGGDFLLRGSA